VQEIYSSLPSSVSLKLIVHLIQEIDSRHFRKFDYGHRRNLEIYGNPNPPDFNISKVTVPTAILHGNYDHLTRIEVRTTDAKLSPSDS
jgi:hypothetical protein